MHNTLHEGLLVQFGSHLSLKSTVRLKVIEVRTGTYEKT